MSHKPFISLVAAITCCSSTLFAKPDFSSTKGWVLKTNAWGAFGKENHQDALAYANKCINLHRDFARKLQKKLLANPDGPQSADIINDVGACQYIKALTLVKLEKKDSAIMVLKSIIREFPSAVNKDKTGGWSISAAARKKLSDLQIEVTE